MGTEFEITEPAFEARIDQLLSSALADQAREQRVLLETVHGARAALDKAEEQLTALRRLIDNRDQAVVDLLEARLSGLSTEESLDRIVARIDTLLQRPPAEQVVGPLAERLAAVSERLDPIEESLSERAADAGAIVQRIDALQIAIAQRLAVVEESVAGDVDTAQDRLTEHLTTLKSQGTQRQDDATRHDNETQEFITEVRAALESVWASIVGQSERQSSGVDEMREEMALTRRELVETLINETRVAGEAAAASHDLLRDVLAASSDSQMRATVEQVSSLRLTIGEAQERLNEAISSAASVTAERASSQSADMRDRLADSYQGLSDSIGAAMSDHRGLLNEIRDSVIDITETASARNFDRLQFLSGQLEEAQATFLALPDRLTGLLDQAREAERARGQRLYESVLALSDTVEGSAADLVPRLNVHLEEERTTNQQRATELLSQLAGLKGAISETLVTLPQRIDSHLDEGRTKDEMRNQAILAQLDQLAGVIRETVAELPPRIGSHLDEARARDDVRNQLVTGYVEEMGRIIQAAMNELPERIENKMQEGATAGENRNSQVVSRVADVLDTISAEQPKITTAIAEGLSTFAEELVSLGERVRQSNRRITESNSRIEGMHESLISYLSERDDHLERVRDETLKDLIAHLVSDLKNRDRVRIAAAMKEGEKRRKDRRDAERWRKLGASEASRQAPPVDLVTEEVEPVEPQPFSEPPEPPEPPELLEATNDVVAPPKRKRLQRTIKPVEVIPVPAPRKKAVAKSGPTTKSKASKKTATAAKGPKVKAKDR